MIKRLLLSFLVLFGVTVAFAQPGNLPPGTRVAFFTSFEQPAALDCVVLGGTPVWQIDTAYRVPGPLGQAIRGRFEPNTSSWITTKPFSTLGDFKVQLRFSHIAKLEFLDSAIVQVSIDGGNTFTTLTGQNCIYLGASANFRTFNRFNQTSYPGPTEWNNANLGAIPQNSWFRNEIFDISSIASNRPDVRIRFRASDGQGNGLGGANPAYGWLVDSILVTTSLSELIQPLISHQPIRNTQFNIDQTFTATLQDSLGCDSTGIFSGTVFFRVNSGPLDSLPMDTFRINTGQPPRYEWRATLARPRLADGDTISYFLRAIDSSPARNVRYFPESNRTGPGGDSVIRYIASTLPTMTHVPTVGWQFSAGPFPIAANVSDASGIDSAILSYRINNGPWLIRKMPLISGILFRDSITVPDGDTVDYFLEAVDSSARRFRRRLPDSIGFWRFIASGDPTVEWPSTSTQCDVYLGVIFSTGPFPIGIRALDGSGIDTVMFYYQVNSGPWDSIGAVRSTNANSFCTWIATLPSTLDGDTVRYYAKAIDASSRRNFTINPSQANPRQFVTLGGIRFPYVDNFDASDVWRGFVASGNPTNPLLTAGGWVRGVPAKSTLNAARSAPNAWMPGPLNANYVSNAWFILESPVFDFSNARNANLSFWQWRNIDNGGAPANPSANGNGDGFWIEYTPDANATTINWVKLGNGNQSDTNQVNWYNRNAITNLAGSTGGAWDGNTTGWERSVRRLVEPVFQGNGNPKSIKFRFVFRSNAINQANGVLIDDFSIVLPVQRDLAVTTIASNAQNLAISQANNNFQVVAGDSVPVFVRLRNLGLQNIDTILPIVVEIPGFYRDTTFINPGTIFPNAFSSQAIRLRTIPVAPPRHFTVRVYSAWAPDANRENDTLETGMFGVVRLNVPSSDNFDGPLNNWLPLPIGAAPLVWQLGVPTGAQLSAAASAPNAWGTNLAGNVGPSVPGVLLSPIYNFRNSVNTRLRFKTNRRITSGGGLRITFADSLLTNWQVVGTFGDPAGINWYNTQTASVANIIGPVWSGQTTGFVEHTLELPQDFNYRPGGGVRFRVEFQSGSTGTAEGVLFDDFEILPPPPREIGIVGILRPVACPDSLRALDTIQVVIRNFGGDTLFQVPFNFNFNNGPLVLANDFVFNGVIPPAAQQTVTLPAFNSPLPAGNYTLRVFTRLSGDARNSNDTISRCVKAIPQNDLIVVRSITPLPALCYPAGPRNVRLIVRNIGHSPTTTFSAGYILDNLPPVTQSFTRSVASNGFDTITISIPVNIPMGQSSIRIFVNATTDPVRGNDTIVVPIFGRDPLFITHLNNFNNNFPLPYCFLVNSNAVIDVRDNIPNSNNPGGKSLFMGTFIQATSFNTAVPAGGPWTETWNAPWLSRLAFPIETTGRDSIRIRFDLLQLASGTAVADRMSYFRVLANGRQIGATFQPLQITPANPAYATIDLRLDTVYTPGEPLIIEFQSKCRFRPASTGNRNGNFIDNIIIYNSMPHGAEVLDVTYTPPFPSQTTPVTVTARIRNTGNAVLNTVQTSLRVNGNVIQTTNASLNIPFMVDTAFTFTTTFQPRLGANDVCVWTVNPNGQQDGYPLDDTLCVEAVGFPVINNFPYCNNFEGNEPPWLSRNPVTLRPRGNTFVFGTPNKTFISGAASGVNAWYIGPDSSYKAYDSSAVYTPIFEVRQGTCYQISFKSKYLTDFWNNNPNLSPLWGDGATLEYSTDGGINFTNFGRLDTLGNEWYVGVIQALRQFNSTPASLGYGWGAKSDSSWMTMRQIFNTTTNNLVLFRFRFGSDDAFQGEGFAFDDFCFEVVPGPCGLVSVNEEELNGFVLKQNYPNPFDVSTTIEYVLPAAGDVKVAVRDLLGREVYAQNQGLQYEGPHSVTLDLKQLEAGVYFYSVRFNGIEQTRKMIISK
jgi:hypothetical protein